MKPARNKLTPRVEVTLDILYSSATGLMATLKIELENVTVKVRRDLEIVMTHLRRVDQFFGLSGSSGPSNSTRSDLDEDIGGAVCTSPVAFSTSASGKVPADLESAFDWSVSLSDEWHIVDCDGEFVTFKSFDVILSTPGAASSWVLACSSMVAGWLQYSTR